jgi:hypothetical protein
MLSAFAVAITGVRSDEDQSRRSCRGASLRTSSDRTNPEIVRFRSMAKSIQRPPWTRPSQRNRSPPKNSPPYRRQRWRSAPNVREGVIPISSTICLWRRNAGGAKRRKSVTAFSSRVVASSETQDHRCQRQDAARLRAWLRRGRALRRGSSPN